MAKQVVFIVTTMLVQDKLHLVNGVKVNKSRIEDFGIGKVKILKHMNHQN